VLHELSRAYTVVFVVAVVLVVSTYVPAVFLPRSQVGHTGNAPPGP
jgi:hypothetical protein